MPRHFAFFFASLLITLALTFRAAAQQPSAEQRQQLVEANKLRAQVSNQIAGRKYEEAGKTLEQLQEAIQKLKDGGLNEKDPSLSSLARFVENQRKILERNKPKDAPKKDSAAKPAEPEPANSGGVSFVKDVAPILARNCQGCHGQNNPRSKFSLATFKGLMKGGEKGDDDVVPGKPDESRLVAMLKGDEEPRMPLRRPAIRRDLIDNIALWVQQGAKFDGAPKFTPDTPLAQIVPTPEEELKAKVAALSEPELLDLHKAKAKEQWAAGNPSKSPETVETEHFIVVGTVSTGELEQAGKWAESILNDLNRLFGRPKDPIWRGKLTVHLFAERYEYTEHAMVVEGREVPREVQGHHFAMIETSYVAVPRPTEESPASFKGLVVEQVAAAFLAAQGETPGWFSTGVGRYLAARSDPKAEIYREYRQQVREAVSEGDPVAGLFDDKGDSSLLGFGLVDFLASLRQGDRGLASLASELRKKTAGDKAVQQVYGLDRRTLAASWAQFAIKRYPAAKRR